MESRVQKWGNSLAVRIPKPFAAEIGLHQDAQVELSVTDGALVITPLPRRADRLADLLSGVRRSNMHGETPTGQPRGKESW